LESLTSSGKPKRRAVKQSSGGVAIDWAAFYKLHYGQFATTGSD